MHFGQSASETIFFIDWSLSRGFSVLDHLRRVAPSRGDVATCNIHQFSVGVRGVTPFNNQESIECPRKSNNCGLVRSCFWLNTCCSKRGNGGRHMLRIFARLPFFSFCLVNGSPAAGCGLYRRHLHDAVAGSCCFFWVCGVFYGFCFATASAVAASC